MTEQTSATPRPVFIIGSPRSGTSILTWAIGQHPNILPVEETGWLVRVGPDLGVAHRIGASRGERSHLSAAGISREEFFEAAGRGFHDLVIAAGRRTGVGDPDAAFALRRSEDDPKARWVDGTPENSFAVYALSLLFPGATFIHLVRDPQHVVRSLIHFSNAGGEDMDPAEAWRKWYDCASHGWLAERALGSRTVLRLAHAELAADPARAVRRCLEHIGEPYHEDCLRPLAHRINSSKVATADVPDGDADLRSRAEELAGVLLAEPQAVLEPDPGALADLADSFDRRVTFLENLPADRLRAIEAMRRLESEKADAQQWALRLRDEVDLLRDRVHELERAVPTPQ